MKQKLNFAEFSDIASRLEIKLGVIIRTEEVQKSKLVKLIVSFGEAADRVCLTNIKANFADPNELVGKKMLFVTNLEPVEMKGIVSECMIMPGTEFGKGPNTSNLQWRDRNKHHLTSWPGSRTSG